MRKNLLLFVCVCCLMFTACRLENFHVGGNHIEPSGNIVTKEYALDSFDRVEIDVIANVRFVQTSEKNCRVELSAPENYVELFSFDVEKSELEVAFVRDNISIDANSVVITIYAPTLHRLENSSVADVWIGKLNAKRLQIVNSGVGNMTLTGLRVGELKADCEGVGGIELSGQTYRTELLCSGVGNIKAEELKSNNVSADVSGVGGIKCYATDSLEAEVSGVGSLKYGGTPKYKQLDRTGVGSISSL